MELPEKLTIYLTIKQGDARFFGRRSLGNRIRWSSLLVKDSRVQRERECRGHRRWAVFGPIFIFELKPNSRSCPFWMSFSRYTIHLNVEPRIMLEGEDFCHLLPTSCLYSDDCVCATNDSQTAFKVEAFVFVCKTGGIELCYLETTNTTENLSCSNRN